MPLPLIPVAIALFLAGGTGTAAGTIGAVDIAAAKRTVFRAKERHTDAAVRYREAERETSQHLADYGRRQLEVQATTLQSWVTWLENHKKAARLLERSTVLGVTAPTVDLPQVRKLVEEANILEGAVGAVVSSIAARQAAIAGVRSLATAGTGTAISSLSGAAAESATLAWLGGGATAAGGGGVVAGGMVMTGVAVAPALLIGGITLAIQGEKAKTQAEKYSADVDSAVAEIDLQVDLLARLRRRCDEIWSVLDRLVERAEASLAKLAANEFDLDRDLHLLQQTALLMAELGQVLSTPLLDEQGDLSAESLIIIERNAA